MKVTNTFRYGVYFALGVLAVPAAIAAVVLLAILAIDVFFTPILNAIPH